GQADGRFRRRDGDDEKREHLAGHVARVGAVERDEREVHRVQHELDAHQLNEDVAPHQKADAAEREDGAGEQHVVLDHHAKRTHQACSFGRGWPASRGCRGPWKRRCAAGLLLGAFTRFSTWARATAMAPTTATMRSAVVSSKGTSSFVKSSRPTSSRLPCSDGTSGNRVCVLVVPNTRKPATPAKNAIAAPPTTRAATPWAGVTGVLLASGPSSITTKTKSTTTAPAYTMS